MTTETTDRVAERKEYRQRILDKLEIETSEVETLRPENDKDLYVRVLEGKMTGLKSMIDEMTEKSKHLEKNLREEYEQDIKMLEMRYATARSKLEGVRQAGENAWKDLQTGAVNALRELGNGIKSAVSKFE